MALRALQGPAGGAAPVGGTGTTNTIPRWTGASTLGDSGITDNGSTVSFVGRNLASTAAQTWTLNTSLSLLSGVVGFYNSGTDGTYGDAIYIGAANYPTSYRHLIRSSVSAISTNSLLKFSLSSGVSTQTDVMTLRGNGNVGIGTAPNAWNSAICAFDLRTNSLWNFNLGSDSVAYWTVNAYTDTAGNVVYKNSAAASQYMQNSGAHVWYRAASGVAGAACSLLESARIDSNGNIYGASGTTGMTNGFFYIPAAAGAPTGVPTAVAGRVPMYYDTTNNQFYVYNGAWKKVTLS